jgi:P4 family phage/plasmid primase-like protien
MTDWSAVSAFMANVVPWPGSPSDPGFVNLHFSSVDGKDPTKLYKGGGWPFRSVDALVSRASWITTTTQFKDVWYCLSRQSETKANHKDPKKPKAHRLAKNAIAVKAIWIDIDVGPSTPEKPKYPTVEEALKAIISFREKMKLPPFSAIVGSGSGVHIYWISDKALTPAEWAPYARGLQALLKQEKVLCDIGLTTDIVRLLRIPGTFNHKTNPPKPVQLFNVPLVMYDFPTALSLLPQIAPAPTTSPRTGKAKIVELFHPDADMSTFAQPAPWGADFDDAGNLQAGIDKFEDTLLDPQPIFTKCGFYHEALVTGGANYDQTLWMYSLLGTTFMENGNAIAHTISKGHVTYSEAETQALYDRKVADRHDRGIGYPSCATIAGAGCEACKTCPLFGKITSPLKLKTMRPEPNQGDGTARQTPDANAGSGGERLVVPKDDHMDRARIYRSKKRPNLYHYRDDYYDHEAGHYTIIDEATIRADLYEFLDHCDKEVPCKGKPTETELVSFAPNKSSVSETGEALKALGHVVPTIAQPHWLDGRAGPNPADLICFPNGILNINSNQFTPPDPMLFTPHGVGFDYNPNAAAPTQWLNFLDQIFDGEQDQIGSLQEMFGYCLSSDVSQEKVFMLLGDKRSGKDTIRHTLQSLLSSTVICGPTLDSMSTNFGMSQLISKQLAVVGDVRLGSKCDKDLLAEHVLKLSGRGLFTIDRKNKSHWTGSLPCKLLLISNEMPTLKDASGALASRIITYRSRTSFYGREDRHLFENKIRPELPAILLWALDGLRRMRQRGPIAEPACSMEAREELAREGSPIMSFVQECLTLDASATVEKNAMYSAYLDFAHHNGLRAADKGWFYRNLDTATASKVTAERGQNGGVRVHNVVGARISNPPPRRPTKNEPIFVYATTPAAAAQTADDVGNASEDDVALDKKVKNMQTQKTGRPKCRRSAGTRPPQQRPCRRRKTVGKPSADDPALDETV